ncbi:MAG: 4-hydroxy-2-oxo-heptane-1,7-dioate aldolase [Gammaproteobacteria bacterium]|nr:MAG: 4-hydroxy-2-oxo-heptane-1,7-dioate aldolase [Gammaproteobacteria bacterium]
MEQIDWDDLRMNDLEKMWENNVLKRLRQGLPAFGISVRGIRSSDIAHVARASGHHFLFVDTQHSIFNKESLYQIAQVSASIGVAPMVRVRSVRDDDSSLLLDNGFQGIIFPDVNTVEEAQHAVSICKFPPTGRRSVAGGYPMFNFSNKPLSDVTNHLNHETLVAVMIETEEGLENIEKIAAVPGIDVIHVGTNDLLTSMGLTGEFDHPKIKEAQLRVIYACKKNQIYAGCGGNRDVQRQALFINKGVQFITTQTDIAFLSRAASTWVSELNDLLD